MEKPISFSDYLKEMERLHHMPGGENMGYGKICCFSGTQNTYHLKGSSLLFPSQGERIKFGVLIVFMPDPYPLDVWLNGHIEIGDIKSPGNVCLDYEDPHRTIPG